MKGPDRGEAANKVVAASIMKYLLACVAGLALVFGGVEEAAADSIYSTFGPGDSFSTSGGAGITNTPPLGGIADLDVANAFTVPIGSNFRLTTIDLALNNWRDF